MPSIPTLTGKHWFGALRRARRLSRLRSRAHISRIRPMRAPECGDARALGKDALRCRVPAAVPARVSSAAVPSLDVPHSRACYSMSRQSAQQCRCSWATPESPKHTAAASDHVRVRPKALEPREQRSSKRAASDAMGPSRDGARPSYSATRRRTARVRVNFGAKRWS